MIKMCSSSTEGSYQKLLSPFQVKWQIYSFTVGDV